MGSAQPTENRHSSKAHRHTVYQPGSWLSRMARTYRLFLGVWTSVHQLQLLLLVFSIDSCHIVSPDVIVVNILIYECVKSMRNMSPHMKALDPTEDYICVFASVTCTYAYVRCGRLLESSWQSQKVIRHWYFLTRATDLRFIVFLLIYIIRSLLINVQITWF